MTRIVTLVGALVALTSCGASSRSASIAAMMGTGTNAKNFFIANCLVCHGADGKTGSAKKDTPSTAKTMPTKAVDSMLNGNNEGMPKYDSLTDQQLADLLAYLKSL